MKKTVTVLTALLLALPFLAACQNVDIRNPSNIADRQSQETAALSWKESRPGLEYAEARIFSSSQKALKNILLVRINPGKFNLGIFQNNDRDNAKTIQEIHRETGSLFTFNGGFFTEDFKPTGLLISNGKTLRAVSAADLLNGIFGIGKDGTAGLIDPSRFSEDKYVFAIQNGPVLIDENGRIAITVDTGKTASRTAIGLDDSNRIIVIVLKQSLLNSDNLVTLHEFAHELKEAQSLKDLNLHSVLNLDGGPSSGMMIGDQYFPEMERVQNVVIVTAK